MRTCSDRIIVNDRAHTGSKEYSLWRQEVKDHIIVIHHHKQIDLFSRGLIKRESDVSHFPLYLRSKELCLAITLPSVHWQTARQHSQNCIFKLRLTSVTVIWGCVICQYDWWELHPSMAALKWVWSVLLRLSSLWEGLSKLKHFSLVPVASPGLQITLWI